MKFLPNVTLLCVDCYNYGPSVEAIKKSLEHIKPHKTVFLTDIDIEVDGIDIIQIPTIKTKEEYSEFMIKKLKDYFYTSHCLVIQHDGYVLDGNAWTDEFLEYDYIGAPWLYPDNNVGNGGFSIRSHRLQMLLAADPFIKSQHPEDEVIGRLYRDYLIKNYSIEIAPFDVAEKFAYELREPICSTFGFHGHFHPPYKPAVVIKRTGAMGDVIMAEPLFAYYYEKGYQVYLDTMVSNMEIFFNHRYQIKHISEKNEKVIPEKTINLDKSYELFPKKNVLEAYFKISGLNLKQTKYYRNSILSVNKNANRWFFEKYIVFHLDDTNLPHRNIYGINWKEAEEYFIGLGYNIIQVGMNPMYKIGLHFNTESKAMLMYLLAGADFVIGIDSGITQLSVALGIKTIIFTGSVNLKLRYQKFDNIEVVKTKCPKEEYEYCYHNTELSEIGTICKIDGWRPPCVNFKLNQLKDAFNKINTLKMKKITLGNNGSGMLQIRIMEAICGDIKNQTMIDLCCGSAPQTGLMNFKEKTYVDVVDRILPDGGKVIVEDVIKYLKNKDKIYDISISTDTIEHFRENDAIEFLELTEKISKKQVWFTPLGAYLMTHDETDNNPDSHKSEWTPEKLEQMYPGKFAFIECPNWHPTLGENGLGAFFFWACDDIENDFIRVEKEFN